MTQRELDQEVAHSTGESVDMIRHRGFSLIVVPEREPHVIDWDDVQRAEPVRPFRPRRRRHSAA